MDTTRRSLSFAAGQVHGAEGVGMFKRISDASRRSASVELARSTPSIECDGERSAVCQEVIKQMLDSITHQPELLRGVQPSCILRNFGASIRVRTAANPSTQHLYEQSFPVTVLRSFVSHSWHASTRVKIMAMLVHYRGTSAIIVGLVSALVCRGAAEVGSFPAMNSNLASIYLASWNECIEPSGQHLSLWGLLGFSVGYWITLLWRPRSAHRVERPVFFDCACIHQTDPHLKAAGIGAIGAYLLKSEELLVLWDPSYLSRLWCVFEIAVYLILNAKCNISFVPISMYCAEAVLIVIWWIGMWGSGILVISGIEEALLRYLLKVGVPHECLLPLLLTFSLISVLCLLMVAVRKMLRWRKEIFRQLDVFSLDHAKCLVEADRAFVADMVRKLYGDTTTFDTFAKSVLKDVISKKTRSSMSLPYWLIVRTLVPGIVICVFDVTFVLDYESCGLTGRLNFTAGWLCLIMCHITSMIKSFETVAHLRLQSKNTLEEACVCLCLGVALTAVFGTWTMLWKLTLGSWGAGKLLSILIGISAVLFLWKDDVRSALQKCLHRDEERLASDFPSDDASVDVSKESTIVLAAVDVPIETTITPPKTSELTFPSNVDRMKPWDYEDFYV